MLFYLFVLLLFFSFSFVPLPLHSFSKYMFFFFLHCSLLCISRYCSSLFSSLFFFLSLLLISFAYVPLFSLLCFLILCIPLPSLIFFFLDSLLFISSSLSFFSILFVLVINFTRLASFFSSFSLFSLPLHSSIKPYIFFIACYLFPFLFPCYLISLPKLIFFSFSFVFLLLFPFLLPSTFFPPYSL